MPRNPLIRYDEPLTLPPMYFGTVDYYALLAAHSDVTIDNALRWDKRKKFVHRCEIVDTRHRIFLTVPVAKDPIDTVAGQPLRWNNIAVSSHNNWWDLHRVALESAYGRTPFFEYYAPSLLPLLGPNTVGRPITELDSALDEIIREILHLDGTTVRYTDTSATGKTFLPPYPTMSVDYYQLRADRLGFQAGLSILDLIFNCGPESPLTLREMMRNFSLEAR